MHPCSEKVPDQSLPTGQLPVTAHLNLGHEVKQISYQVGLRVYYCYLIFF